MATGFDDGRTMCQEMWPAYGSWKRRENGFSGLCKEMQPHWQDLSSVKTILD